MTKRSFAPRLRHLSIRAYFVIRHSCFVIPLHLVAHQTLPAKNGLCLFLLSHSRHRAVSGADDGFVWQRQDFLEVVL